MFYREIAPPPHLRDLIFSFWEFLGPEASSAPVVNDVFPDGCVSLFYFRNSITGLNHVGLTPLHLKTIARPISAGDIFWGMRISPAACASVLTTDPGAMRVDQQYSPGQFPHLTAGVADLLENARSLEDAIPVFESRMEALSVEIDDRLAAAVRAITDNDGEIKIEHLGRMVGLSTRHLQRLFKASSGMSPKQFARIRRIRAAASILVDGKPVNWADRALEMGFSDQSHLTNEFSSVTKSSPIAFARKIRSIKHGTILK